MQTANVYPNACFFLFIRMGGVWFHDCTTWNWQEMLAYYHNEPSSLSNKRVVIVNNDDENTILKATRYLNYINTKAFVDLRKEF